MLLRSSAETHRATTPDEKRHPLFAVRSAFTLPISSHAGNVPVIRVSGVRFHDGAHMYLSSSHPSELYHVLLPVGERCMFRLFSHAPEAQAPLDSQLSVDILVKA